MAKLELNISVTDTDAVKTLIALINKHKNELPQPLIQQLEKVADCEVFELTFNHLRCYGLFYVIADGVKIDSVKSINPILRVITTLNNKTPHDELKITYQTCQLVNPENLLLKEFN